MATEDLPVCVLQRETALNPNTVKSFNEESESEIIVTTEVSEESLIEEKTTESIDQNETDQNLSQNLPLVVLEFNERSKNND